MPFSSGIPRSRHALVRRARLFDSLTRGARGPVTLVSGPAGSGKTLLVASWLSDASLTDAVVWISVDGKDDTRFWRSVVDGLQASDAAVGLEAIQALAIAPGGPGAAFVVRLIRGLRDLTRPVVIVLDDVDRLESADARDGLAVLLAAAPRRLHVILIARRVPRLGLHRLRVSGDLTTLDGVDLAFTAAETRELLSTSGIDVSQTAADRLCEQTEGWATGLRLAAMSLLGRPEPDSLIARFSGGERTIAAYLAEEILDCQPPAVQRLLLRTSVLEQVNGELAKLLSGLPDGERVLADLEEANAFVTAIEAGGSWFRYHPLFADVLRRQLRREAPEDIDELHRAAARWYEGHGFAVDAMRHAQAGADWGYAGELLVEHWFSLALDGRQTTLHGLLDALPREVVAADAELVTLLAADRLAAGGPADVDAYLERADQLSESVTAGHRHRFELAHEVVKLTRARSRGDFAAAAVGAEAMLGSAGDTALAKGFSNEDLRALALMNLGAVEHSALRLDDAERHLLEGVALARSIKRPYITVGCLALAAGVANIHGRTATAEDRAREALELANRHGWSEDPIVGGAYLALGGVLFAAGSFEASALWFGRASRALRGVRDPEATVILPNCLGALRFAQGRYDEAIAHLRDAERGCDALLASHYMATFARAWRVRAQIRLGDTGPARAALAAEGEAAGGVAEWCNVAAELHLAEDAPSVAIDALAPVLDGSATAFSISLKIDALLLEAIARDRRGEQAESEGALERALDLAEQHGRSWMLLIVPALRPLLQRRARGPARPYVADILDRLSTVRERPGAGARAVPHPTLTPRELTVLRFLPTNLTAGEVATEMFLSVHTVKMHIRHLYAKLDVHRRTNAVKRARELGLL